MVRIILKQARETIEILEQQQTEHNQLIPKKEVAPRICVQCGKELPKRKLKYCDDHCQYWYKHRDSPSSGCGSGAQQRRMNRAARGEARRRARGGPSYY